MFYLGRKQWSTGERDSISNSTRVFIYYYRIGQQCAKNINYLMARNCISCADFPEDNFKFKFSNVSRENARYLLFFH